MPSDCSLFVVNFGSRVWVLLRFGVRFFRFLFRYLPYGCIIRFLFWYDAWIRYLTLGIRYCKITETWWSPAVICCNIYSYIFERESLGEFIYWFIRALYGRSTNVCHWEGFWCIRRLAEIFIPYIIFVWNCYTKTCAVYVLFIEWWNSCTPTIAIPTCFLFNPIQSFMFWLWL